MLIISRWNSQLSPLPVHFFQRENHGASQRGTSFVSWSHFRPRQRLARCIVAQTNQPNWIWIWICCFVLKNSNCFHRDGHQLEPGKKKLFFSFENPILIFWSTWQTWEEKHIYIYTYMYTFCICLYRLYLYVYSICCVYVFIFIDIYRSIYTQTCFWMRMSQDQNLI